MSAGQIQEGDVFYDIGYHYVIYKREGEGWLLIRFGRQMEGADCYYSSDDIYEMKYICNIFELFKVLDKLCFEKGKNNG